MGRSYFDGGLFQLIGYRLLGSIITVCIVSLIIEDVSTLSYWTLTL